MTDKGKRRPTWRVDRCNAQGVREAGPAVPAPPGADGPAVLAATGAVNSFRAFSTVLYTPHAAGMPTTSQATKMSAIEVSFRSAKESLSRSSVQAAPSRIQYFSATGRTSRLATKPTNSSAIMMCRITGYACALGRPVAT